MCYHKATPTGMEVNAMPSSQEIEIVRKATVYDLQEVLCEQAEEGTTYTPEDIRRLLRAYIKGTEQ